MFLHALQLFGTMFLTMSKRSLLTEIRKSRGLTLDDVAQEVGTDPTNLSRIEKGVTQPKRPVARKLYDYYGGAVPLGAVYDPLFYGEHGLRCG